MGFCRLSLCLCVFVVNSYFDAARAISEFVLLNSELIENRQKQIRHRSVGGIAQVAPAF